MRNETQQIRFDEGTKFKNRTIMEYRRARIEGGTYFFTVVTYHREKIFCIPSNVALLIQVLRQVIERHPFKIDAFVLLPDHLHSIWTLPQGDANFSMRWRLIKSYFSRKCKVEERKPTIQPGTASRLKKNEQTIWQHRFWEHIIRDDQDFIRHVEYIHYNPVKHGLVKAPKDWTYSSFHRYVRDGVYDPQWAAGVYMEFESTVGGE